MLDLQHAGAFLSGLVVACDENYEKSANSDICIITAGVRQAVRMQFMQNQNCSSAINKLSLYMHGSNLFFHFSFQEGETRLDLAARNVAVLKSIVPPLVRYSPDAIFLVVSNPAGM